MASKLATRFVYRWCFIIGVFGTFMNVHVSSSTFPSSSNFKTTDSTADTTTSEYASSVSPKTNGETLSLTFETTRYGSSPTSIPPSTEIEITSDTTSLPSSSTGLETDSGTPSSQTLSSTSVENQATITPSNPEDISISEGWQLTIIGISVLAVTGIIIACVAVLTRYFNKQNTLNSQHIKDANVKSSLSIRNPASLGSSSMSNQNGLQNDRNVEPTIEVIVQGPS